MEQKTCKTSVGAASDHFVDISKMIEFPIGAEAPHKLEAAPTLVLQVCCSNFSN